MFVKFQSSKKMFKIVVTLFCFVYTISVILTYRFTKNYIFKKKVDYYSSLSMYIAQGQKNKIEKHVIHVIYSL